MKFRACVFFMCSVMVNQILAQSLPDHWTLDEQNHRLIIGGITETDIFETATIHQMDIEFSQSNWWSLLGTNYNSATDLSATVTIDGEVYEQVGVRFKGQTSYMMTNGEEKKSFNITMDSFIAGQDHDGYSTFNLNNCFQDPSFLREFIYLYHIRSYVPAARASFVHLNINGESWGIYPCVEGLNGDYLKDWFLSNDGTRWRADAPGTGFGGGGGGGGGGPQWGDGTAALNWLGSDQAEYEQYYTLKSTTQTDPWSNLIETCDVLNNTPASELPTALPDVLDIDRTLWFLACENAFGDDDSYIFKGKMDYYVYWEIETGRLVPLEYDGNSILVEESMDWGPFYNATNANYPLLNKMLAVGEWRQRYLAHLRTILNDAMDADLNAQLFSQYIDLIQEEVQADDKKLYTYSEFLSNSAELEDLIQERKATIYANSEVNTTGALIENVVMSTNGGEWVNPVADEEVSVTATVTSADGVQFVYLWYSNAWVGNFSKIQMFDDGNHNDGGAGDNLYGASMPGQSLGTTVRFYIEARENNTAHTASFMPEGAEHDVYVYTVAVPWASSTDVVINEVMALNNTGFITDEASEEEDWIELFNKGSVPVDLGGYYLTDNTGNLDKWEFPDYTIQPGEYLIVWADEDSTQGMWHANFKLSSSGESISLINANTEIADGVTFGDQQENMGYARVPNGTGPFAIQGQTFASNNDFVSVSESGANEVLVYPNPVSDELYISGAVQGSVISIYNGAGSLAMQIPASGMNFDVSDLSAGYYVVRIMTERGMKSVPLIKN